MANERAIFAGLCDGFGRAAIGVEHGIIGRGVVHLAVNIGRRGLGQPVRAGGGHRLAGFRTIGSISGDGIHRGTGRIEGNRLALRQYQARAIIGIIVRRTCHAIGVAGDDLLGVRRAVGTRAAMIVSVVLPSALSTVTSLTVVSKTPLPV